MSDLNILIPAQTVETSAGSITLKPFKFRDFQTALTVVSKYVDLIATAESSGDMVRRILSSGGSETLGDVATLIKLTSGKDPEFLDDLSWDEVFGLLLTIVEQNLDFFFRAGERLGSLGKKAETPNQQTQTGPDPSAT